MKHYKSDPLTRPLPGASCDGVRPHTKAIFASQLAGLTLLMVGCFSAVQAQTSSGPKELYSRSLAATCANCHGTDGRAAAGSSLPSIAGQDRVYLVAQLKAFRDGSRPATVMHQISKGYKDAQIEVLADYFAAQKK
ncbi:MAG: c-type cytochrome [Pseudomonadota bacterium]